MTIAVDFDGTIVEHRYPEIGEEKPFAVQTLRMPRENFWTMPLNGAASEASSSTPSTATIRKRPRVEMNTTAEKLKLTSSLMTGT